MATRIPTLSAHNIRNVSPEELYSVVCDAASQDPSRVKSSSDRLKEMFDMTGTCDSLSEIAAQKSIPLQVRQQSVIQLKNCVLSHWRSRRLIPEEHRARIRARCLLLLDEPDDIIAECNEVIASKIARSDYPIQWPNLINDLSNVIQQNISARYSGGPSHFLPLRRSLEILNAVIKEISSAKMMAGVKNMGQIVEQQHLALQAYYSTVAPFLNALDPTTILTHRSSEDILLSHLIFKCLVKCATWLFHRVKDGQDKARATPWLRELFQSSVVQLRTLSELRINLLIALRSSQPTLDPTTQQNVINLTRHILLFGKFFRRLQQLDSARFVLLPACSDLVLYYWSKVVQATNGPPELIEDTQTAVFPVRFLVQAMVIFKESLAQWAPVRKDGSPNEQVLSKEFVEGAVKLLVTRFIPLNPSDLEEWMADPEEWVNVEEKESDQWQYELRPCGERVLMTMANQCEVYVRPLLEATWKQVRAHPSTDLTSILQKEALYCALGRCAVRMKGVITLEEWLSTDLATEVRSTNPSFPIIKRRIAWLIGKWISSECSPPNNPIIWEVLVYLLQDRGPGTDAVVRLTAAVALQECIDTLSFDLDIFAPFLPSIVPELIKLQAEADTLESKRRIANSLNTVVERAGIHIVPLVGVIAEPLPQLWLTAGEDWLFKASLLGTVSKLIGSTKEHSTPLCALVVPLVRDSFTPTARVQLDEDALELWQAALRNTTTLDSINGSPGLGELLPLAISLLGENLDLAGRTVDIVESYCLLDPCRILQACSVDLFRSVKSLAALAPAPNVKSMMDTVNLLLQLTPAELWGEALHVSGFFVDIVKALEEEKASSNLLMHYVLFMARIALGNNQVFRELMKKTTPVLNVSEEQIYNIVLTQWWTRFDNMYEPRHRKLTAMGIASLVATGQDEVLDRLATEICNMWLDVFGEIREAQESAAENDGEALTLYWDQSPEDLFHDVQGTPEFSRRVAAYKNDPVRTQLFSAFVTASLRGAEAAVGGGAILQQKWLSKADPLVLGQLQKELGIN